MKILDAVWEKRNLGVDTTEIEIENSDLETPERISWVMSEIKESLSGSIQGYCVIRLEAGHKEAMPVLRRLQEFGFQYAESQLELKYNIQRNAGKLLRLQKILADGKQSFVTSKEELAFIASHIGLSMFSTDRIAQDPFFGLETANRRYQNWVYDEYKKGSDVFLIYAGGLPIGFSIMKTIGKGIRRSLLGGVFPEYQKSGFALYNTGISLLHEWKSGTRIVETSVSSNNLAMLKLDEYLGLKVHAIKTILIKHGGKTNES